MLLKYQIDKPSDTKGFSILREARKYQIPLSKTADVGSTSTPASPASMHQGFRSFLFLPILGFSQILARFIKMDKLDMRKA
jgi:hypothetical protein